MCIAGWCRSYNQCRWLSMKMLCIYFIFFSLLFVPFSNYFMQFSSFFLLPVYEGSGCTTLHKTVLICPFPVIVGGVSTFLSISFFFCILFRPIYCNVIAKCVFFCYLNRKLEREDIIVDT